ncbi:hypothetical protein ACEPPN_002649 [Leptodophora sp. 'Broadleaf-Isolate-01']
MSQPLWIEVEDVVFRHYILPQSQYCKGVFNRTIGMGWKELAPMMQAEMSRLGFPDQRVYTEAVLSQQYYKLFSAHSLSGGEGDIPRSMAPLRSQPGSQPHHPPNRIRAPARVRLRPGYISRFTQTDPKEFADLSVDEALSVHANTEGQSNHDLGGEPGRSRRDDRKTPTSGYEIEGYYRNDSADRGGQKRKHQDYEDDDTRSMGVDEYRKYNASQRKVEEYLHHPSRKSTPAHQESIPSNTGTYGDEDLPAFEDPNPARGIANNNAQREKPRTTRGFVLHGLESPDESDFGILRDPFPIPRKETKDEIKARLDSYEDELRVEDEERRKRPKTGRVEPRPNKAFILDTLDDFSDGEMDIFNKGPLRRRPETDEAFDGNGSAPVKKGMFIDGVYQPIRRRGFSARPSFDQDQAPLLDDSEPAIRVQSQLTSPEAPAQKKLQGDNSNKSKAPRDSENAVTKKKERKNTGPSTSKAPAVKKSKKVPSKMSNKLPQVTSKHPIEYTNRPVPFFESVKLPPISKKSGSAKPHVGKDPVGRGQNGDNSDVRGGHHGENRGFGGSSSVRQPTKKPLTQGDVEGRPSEKRVNLGGTIHKISDLPAAVKRTFKIDVDGNIPDSFLSKNTPVAATATVPPAVSTPAPARNLSSIKESIHENTTSARLSTLKSIVAGANVETRVEDAPSWAKAIAAQRGFRGDVHALDPVSAPAHGGENKGNGAEKAVSPKK